MAYGLAMYHPNILEENVEVWHETDPYNYITSAHISNPINNPVRIPAKGITPTSIIIPHALGAEVNHFNFKEIINEGGSTKFATDRVEAGTDELLYYWTSRSNGINSVGFIVLVVRDLT